jgi:hypothetical protein
VLVQADLHGNIRRDKYCFTCKNFASASCCCCCAAAAAFAAAASAASLCISHSCNRIFIQKNDARMTTKNMKITGLGLHLKLRLQSRDLLLSSCCCLFWNCNSVLCCRQLHVMLRCCYCYFCYVTVLLLCHYDIVIDMFLCCTI